MANGQVATITPEAAPEPSTSDVLENMTSVERQAWKISGKMPGQAEPKATEPEVKEESAPLDAPKETKSETPPKEPKAAPVSEASPPTQEKPEQKVSGAEKRIKQLLGQVKELKGQLETAPAPSVAPKVEATPAPTADVPAKPTVNDTKSDGSAQYDTYEDFLDARDAWNEERTKEKIQAAMKTERDAGTRSQKEAEIVKQNKATEETWNERVAEATTRHPDFAEVALTKDFMDSIQKGSVLDAFVLLSPQGPDVLYHLAGNPDDFNRISALGPLDQSRELFKLEQGFAPVTKPTPAPKPTTKAPPPPTELAGKGTPPLDEVASAGNRGDFTAFKNAANARDIKSRKG